MTFKKGDRVRVTTKLVELPNRDLLQHVGLDRHPHAGKTGVILDFDGLFIAKPNGPTAHIKIDAGFADAGNIMIVSVKYLETP